uniref:Poly(A) polymerase catalytic subunit domain-containing protein n=1 Tax=viral metagenome TaxID=1070528 RepID=A0A6C0F1V6_9ZZZZ
MEELAKIVEDLEDANNREAAADPAIKTSLGVVEAFLKTHPVLCYGGTAINALLPKKDRFYDPEVEVPDYDFFSKTPQAHSVMIANQLVKHGIKEVEVKPGMHLGTFKVFADYTGVADITSLTPEVFDRLWGQAEVRNGIHFVPPNFLRMSMYLELSRPRGDVSRWEKVYKRLTLLNAAHPVTCKKEEGQTHDTLTAKQQKGVIEMLKNEPIVLLSVSAAEIHLGKKWTTPIGLLAERETIEALTKGQKVVVHEENDILPRRTMVMDEEGKKSMFRFYETTACHSYHEMKNGVRVASIPTTLQFFFAYMYSGADESNIASVLCIAQRLVDLANSKPSRRFEILTPKECLGDQETLTDMKKNKAKLYADLGKDKSSPEYLEYFFTYDPSDAASKKKAKAAIKKLKDVKPEESSRS